MNEVEKRETINLLVNCRDTINEAIGNINRPEVKYWVWRKLSDNYSDANTYCGTEDVNARICDIIVDGVCGDVVMEINCVEIHFPETSYYRTFDGKNGSLDRFFRDNSMGYSFGEWAVGLMESDSFGMDDIRDILGMIEH